MTRKTSDLIEPSDIAALRIECNECHSVLSVPLSRDIDVTRLLVCPHCQAPWIKLTNGPSAERAVSGCISAIKDLNQILRSGKFAGFALSLEIDPAKEV